MEVGSKERKAMEKALEVLDIQSSEEQFACLVTIGYLTINRGHDGKDYAWFYDGDHESCIEVETLRQVDAEEIEKLFQ